MTDEPAGITFYWRPGCGFCARLERALVKADIPLERHNIWDDPAAAAAVRSIARGNETVPTLVIGPVGMVNPSPREVVDTMREHTPDLLPEALR
ncbi:MAG: glutaredoxin domain-containing protein [Microthrixaceae bacterium]